MSVVNVETAAIVEPLEDVKTTSTHVEKKRIKPKTKPKTKKKPAKKVTKVVKKSAGKKKKKNKRKSKVPIKLPKGRNGDKDTVPRAKRPHRFKPGTVALRQIRKAQKTVNLQLPKLPFERLCREILQDTQEGRANPVNRVGGDAIAAAQEAAEAYIVEFFDKVNTVAVTANRQTILKRDIDVVLNVQMPGLNTSRK